MSNRVTRGQALVGTIKGDNTEVILMKSATVARTDTTAKDLFVLPANATLHMIQISGDTASDAATTAVLDVGTTADGDHYVVDFSVKTNGAKSNHAPAVNLGDVGASDVQVTATYAETGTASTTGGPWTVRAYYSE